MASASGTCSSFSAWGSTRPAHASDPVMALTPSGVDNVFKWGMDCPDCIYAGAPLRPGESYRLWGNRGSARYVGLQSMAGMASSANVLLDELDLGPTGEVELVLSAEEHAGNWLPIAEDASILVIRHFFYDWDTEVASSLYIERIGQARSDSPGPTRPACRGRTPDDCARGLRRRQPRVLPAVLPARDPTPSCLPSTAPPWGQRRRTVRSSARGSWPPARRSWWR